MLFTRAGYEQSSSEPIARYRAARFGDARRVADLCCGIGGDLLALASGREALAVDRDEVHARLALHNAAVYGQAENVRAVVESEPAKSSVGGTPESPGIAPIGLPARVEPNLDARAQICRTGGLDHRTGDEPRRRVDIGIPGGSVLRRHGRHAREGRSG